MTAHCKGTLDGAGTLSHKSKSKVHCTKYKSKSKVQILISKVSNEQDLYD